MRGLYVHIPFCKRKCPYCDFNSYWGIEKLIPEYFEGLKRESEKFSGEEICTVYIGGGTPSIADEALISQMLDRFRETFVIDKEAEITIEANPATLSEKKLKTYLASGINRISVGVQSFGDTHLKTLGRLHNAKEAKEAVLLAKKSGFDNISCDLMFGLPNQTEKQQLQDIKTAVSLPVTHISCYGLKVEEGTPFYERGITPADDELYTQMYEQTADFLKTKGFDRYEISNFAKEGNRSKHNLLYWKCREYIGLGAGAHSYYKGKRYSNPEGIEAYLRGDREENVELLSDRDKLVEQLIMGMRLSEGVEKEVALALGSGKALERFIKEGFIKEEKSNISFTPKGINVSNYILSQMI